MNAQQALERLKSGNQRFQNDTLQHNLQDSSRRAELTGGQAPWAIILSCADSRVVPEQTFDTGLGEIFILRVAGNVANPSTIASIEYAVANLGTKLIVVMGHEACGAVGAAIAGGDNGPNLNTLTGYIQRAVSDGGEMADVVKSNARYSAADLVDNSEIISNAVANDDVQIVSAYYNLGSGAVDFD